MRGFGSAATVLVLVALTLAAGCGGGSTASTPTTSPKLTTSEVVTSTPTPTNEATPTPQLKELADGEYKPTTIEELGNSIDVAFERHPEAVNLKYKVDTSTSTTRTLFAQISQRCQAGDPQDVGKPNATAADRVAGCIGITGTAMSIYDVTGAIEFWQLAVDSRNYIETELPDHLDDFNRGLEQSQQDGALDVEE